VAEQAKIEERRDLIAYDQNFASPRNLDVVQLAIIGYKATWCGTVKRRCRTTNWTRILWVTLRFALFPFPIFQRTTPHSHYI